MFRKICNWFGRFTSKVVAPDPRRRSWGNKALKGHLKEYPHLCSMKNFKVLEIIDDNSQLLKDNALLQSSERYLNERIRDKDQEIYDLLKAVVEMSNFSVIENPSKVMAIMREYGYKVSEKGEMVRSDYIEKEKKV